MKFAFAAVTLGVMMGYAQQKAPTFEVASIKINNSGSGNSSTHGSVGWLKIENQSLKELIQHAYDVKDFSFIGPGWLDTERFDVMAKLPDGATPDQLLPMLQVLLAERFSLRVHREEKTMAGYALVLAKSGEKLKRGDEKEVSSSSSGRGTMTASATTMKYFAEMLAREVDRPVEDRTGLAGTYKFKLNWTPDDSAAEAKLSDSPGTSFFTALEEQLGLKLKAQKVSVAVLVVDGCEKVPTEN